MICKHCGGETGFVFVVPGYCSFECKKAAEDNKSPDIALGLSILFVVVVVIAILLKGA
jgi:hypothetical protein